MTKLLNRKRCCKLVRSLLDKVFRKFLDVNCMSNVLDLLLVLVLRRAHSICSEALTGRRRGRPQYPLYHASEALKIVVE